MSSYELVDYYMDRFMSFPRRRESSKTYKKLVFLGLFYQILVFVLILRLFFLDSCFRRNDIKQKLSGTMGQATV
ncbi:MAG TPA: hypothetical protein LFV92_07095 [Rickettsia endosymbiont of Ceroptres masudai]|nr:hypothetical protein [Rickettsia endosymbiont of Ceroptres masudai]